MVQHRFVAVAELRQVVLAAADVGLIGVRILQANVRRLVDDRRRELDGPATVVVRDRIDAVADEQRGPSGV
jgi:hypothetical protein